MGFFEKLFTQKEPKIDLSNAFHQQQKARLTEELASIIDQVIQRYGYERFHYGYVFLTTNYKGGWTNRNGIYVYDPKYEVDDFLSATDVSSLIDDLGFPKGRMEACIMSSGEEMRNSNILLLAKSASTFLLNNI